MAQEELTPIIHLKPAILPELVKALCALTGSVEPAEPFTGPQLKVLIWRACAAAIVKYRAEHPNTTVEGGE